jgi:hypothetical protein
MSLCLKEIISQKKALTALMFAVFIYGGILPPQVAKQLHKNAQLNLQNIYFNQPLLAQSMYNPSTLPQYI